jgi:hypothetical protein
LLIIIGEAVDETLTRDSAGGEEDEPLADIGAEARSASNSFVGTRSVRDVFTGVLAEKKDVIPSIGAEEEREGEPTSDSGDSESGETEVVGIGKGAEEGMLGRLNNMEVGAEEERAMGELSGGEEGGEEDGDRLRRLRREISTSFRDRLKGTASIGSGSSPRASNRRSNPPGIEEERFCDTYESPVGDAMHTTAGRLCDGA